MGKWLICIPREGTTRWYHVNEDNWAGDEKSLGFTWMEQGEVDGVTSAWSK